MEHSPLGLTGLQVSRLGLGCNNFGDRSDRETSIAVIRRALDIGITLFDTANTYGLRGGSEIILGEALQGHRNSVVLATKFGGRMGDGPNDQGASRRNLVNSVEDSLRRLRTDWIDHLQLHHPDPLVPIEETLRALDDLVRSGKVRYIGCSNLAAWQVVEAHWTARSQGLNRFATSQDEYSLLNRGLERDLIPALAACGMGIIPYYPLAGGMLTGKYSSVTDIPADARFASGKVRRPDQFLNERNLALVGKLRAFCDRRGRTLLELAMSWLASRPLVSAIIVGASRPDQLDQNAEALGWTLTQADLEEIDGITLDPVDACSP